MVYLGFDGDGNMSRAASFGKDIIPWTQEREDALVIIQKGFDDLSQRIEKLREAGLLALLDAVFTEKTLFITEMRREEITEMRRQDGTD